MKRSTAVRQSGFTILELLITTGIAMIIFSIAMVGLEGSRRAASFSAAVEQLASDANQARIDSLGGKIHDSSAPKGGYGMGFHCQVGATFVDYCRFADVNGDGIIDPDEVVVSGNFDQLPFVRTPMTISDMAVTLNSGAIQAVTQAALFFKSSAVKLVTTPDTSGMLPQQVAIGLVYGLTGERRTIVIDAGTGLFSVGK